uniref:Uncharacterized protein n=1 Tax=Taeniopygia guttata TaxID=59729 RepID=A0A674HQB9_TAEGU
PCRRSLNGGAVPFPRAAKYKERGTVLAEDQLAQMSRQLETFRTHLQAFASRHKQEIRRSPEFRLHFQHMCAIGNSREFPRDCSWDWNSPGIPWDLQLQLRDC